MSSIAVGIDLGTTNSCVAVFQNGRIEIIEKNGKRTVPSFVFYGDNGTIVGEEAVNMSAIVPQNGIFDAKRLIGRKFSDADVQNDLGKWPFTVVKNDDDECRISLVQKNETLTITPEEVSAQVLLALKESAGQYVGEEVVDAVITVPAYFSNPQRQATKDAASIAGLNVLKLLNEPTAAAMAFCMELEDLEGHVVLVYDLGGGTFDVSVIRFEQDEGNVVAVSGDCHLGGRDFDNNLLAYCMDEIKSQYGFAIVEQKDNVQRRAIRRLRYMCEEVKKKLSASESAVLDISEFYGVNVELTITRHKFEELNRHLFDRTIDIVDRTLADCGIDKNDINDVILVGGSTRIPKIQELLSDCFGGRPLNKSVNPDEAVAVGAAYQAALLNDDVSQSSDSNYLFKDVTPLGLGVETFGAKMSFIIPRNSPIPSTLQKTYVTSHDDQAAVKIFVYEGESGEIADNILLGEFAIEGITPRPAGEVEILVEFQMDYNGILNVTAEESSQKIKKDLNIVLSNGRLTAEEIQQMIARANANKAEDD